MMARKKSLSQMVKRHQRDEKDKQDKGYGVTLAAAALVKMVPLTNPYKLSSLIQAHDLAVKSLAYLGDKEGLLVSASRDGLVKVWGLNEANEASLLHSHHEHGQFVNAVDLAHPSLAHPAGLVASGGADNNVRLFDMASGNTTACLSGHTKNVCCLLVNGNKAISGSWDGSAIVWDLASGSKLYSLEGHSIAVWCVLALQNNIYITGSADRTIKIWKQDKCIKTLTGHTDCVRALQVLDEAAGTFLSAGNDNSIRFWNMDGKLLDSIENAHDAFIYSLTLLDNGMLASAGEDRCMKIWDLSTKSCIQSIPVPATSIWTLQALEGGDLACGTDDGYVYIYSNEVGRQLFDEALLEVYEEKLRTATISRGTMDSIENSQVATKERLDQPGDRPGQHILVEDGGKVGAYQWDGVQWIKIGDVVDSSGSTARQEYNGELYDYVFDVQVEDGAGGLKLPYNISDNPYSAAQKFVADNSLPPEYVDQVVDFILKQTGGKPKSEQKTLFNPYMTCESPEVEPETGYMMEPVRLANANLDGILKKFTEFNGTQQVPLNMKPVSDLVKYLKKASRERPEGLTAVFDVLSHWNTEQLFPVFDLVRVSVLDDKLAQDFADFITSVCISVVPAPVPANPKVAQVNVLMQLRVLVNAFQSPSLWSILFEHRGTLIKTLRSLGSYQQPKDASLPFEALFNFCFMLGNSDLPSDDPVPRALLALLLEKITSGFDDTCAKLLISAIYQVRKVLPKAQLRALYTELDGLKQSHLAHTALVTKLIADLQKYNQGSVTAVVACR